MHMLRATILPYLDQIQHRVTPIGVHVYSSPQLIALWTCFDDISDLPAEEMVFVADEQGDTVQRAVSQTRSYICGSRVVTHTGWESD